MQSCECSWVYFHLASDLKSEKGNTSPATMENRRKSNHSVMSVQQGSESGSISKVNGSILHNRDPVNAYHRKEKRRVRSH